MKEIRDQISSEIRSVVSSIKEEFVTTTNTLKIEQSNIKLEMGKLDKKITNLSLNIKSELNNIQTASAGLKSELNDMFEKFSNENSHNNSKLKIRQDQVEKEINDLKASIQFTSQQYDDLKAGSSSSTSNSKRINSLDEEISSTKNMLQVLQRDLDDQQQRDRFLNIEIVGLPERKSENLAKLVINMSEHINTPITLQDIDHIHRVQPRQQIDGRSRVVVCKLRSRLTKSNILAGFRKARGLNTEDIGIDGPAVKIYIREHLTSKNKDLYKEARRACVQRGFKYCWIKNCKILVRKNDNCPFFQINTLEDLKKII
ncbi:uncharacterized protein LOC123880425 [Maniola jurtina]|uniref:uncharacterized protein LOC123880425 n=1 Tax=Maniola jurtina TaxID=191418 RepID=UPI001E68E625|nr:uncharacterized protein LOC123880425 [Maniola jurtina]